MFSCEKGIYTVHELTLAIKAVVTDGKFTDVWIRGEISNFTNHSSGHRYFTLKDKNSSLSCVMFKWYGQKLRFELEHGMKVLVLGDIDVYELRGQYQLKVREIQTDGIGELYKAYELLKNKLAIEGLFSPERKRKLPGFPKKIGVATSPTGAVLHDILTVLKRRFPIDILFVPTIVQGESGAKSIVNSIEALNKTDVDMIILGRGGGSIEDLWPFNEEIVAHAVYNSRIPIISAVGHETDFTIADFVADVRAPTPSAAAEIAVPDRKEIYNQVIRLNDRLTDAQLNYLAGRQTVLNDLKKCADPGSFLKNLGDHIQHLDDLTQRQDLSMKRILEGKSASFGTMTARLDAVSPLGTLLRGYSIVLKLPGKDLITSIASVKKKDNIQIIVTDGRINCEVNDKEECKWK